MLKYLLITLVMATSFLNAENIQSIEKLKVEKEALALKLETYALKKQIIEMELFIENAKIEKQERIDREKALIQLKNDLRAKRNRENQNYKG